jgi:hypothetical protein
MLTVLFVLTTVGDAVIDTKIGSGGVTTVTFAFPPAEA